MKCCADDAHFSRQLRRVVGPQVLCAAPFFAVRRPEKCEPVLRGGGVCIAAGKRKKGMFSAKKCRYIVFLFIGRHQSVCVKIYTKYFEVINIYQVAGMKLFSQTQSGRLDVRKSGVCGAGLNRNME